MRIFRFLAFAGILILASSTAVADPISVYFSPADSNQTTGSSFTIDILANVPQDPGLVDFGFNLLWNESLMQLTGVSGTGTPWDLSLWDPGTPELITGFLYPTPTSPDSVSGAGVLLATLSFTCLQPGTSTLDIGFDPDLLALGLEGFYGPGSTPIDISVTEGSVTQQSPIPEPATLILLLSGGVASLACRKKRTA